MKTFYFILLTAFSALAIDFTTFTEYLNFGTKANFEMTIPTDMRTIREHPDDGSHIITIPDKRMKYSSGFWDLVRLGCGISYAERIEFGVWAGLSGGEFKDVAPTIVDSRSLDYIMEVDYFSSDSSGDRAMGSALVYYKPAVKDLPYGLYMNITPIKFKTGESTLGIILSTKIHPMKIVAQNGWDRYGSLQANEDRAALISYPLETGISLCMYADEKLYFRYLSFNLIFPYLFTDYRNKAIDLEIKKTIGWSLGICSLSWFF